MVSRGHSGRVSQPRWSVLVISSNNYQRHGDGHYAAINIYEGSNLSSFASWTDWQSENNVENASWDKHVVKRGPLSAEWSRPLLDHIYIFWVKRSVDDNEIYRRKKNIQDLNILK